MVALAFGAVADKTFDEELMDSVRACRGVTELHERVRFAEEIVVRVGPMLEAFVSGRCPAEAVEDIVQEVLTNIAKGASTFRGQTARQFWSWCYRIASRRVADHLRRRSNQPVLSLDVEGIRRAVEATAGEAPISEEDLAKVEMALELLARSKPPCVEYLTLHFIEGLDYRELARSFGTTPNAMRMQIQRCLTLARELIEERG